MGYWQLHDSDLPYPRDSLHGWEWSWRETCAADTSWKYEWLQYPPLHSCLDGGSKHERLLTGTELCDLLPQDMSLFMVGDSLTGQFATSWRTRLRHSGAGQEDCGPAVPISDFTAIPDISEPHQTLRLPWSCCKNGPRVEFVQAWNWVISENSACALKNEDEPDDDCAHLMCQDPAAFGFAVLTPEQFARTFENATHVVLNEYGHLDYAVRKLEACYKNSTKATQSMLKWWKSQMEIKADTLMKHTRARSFYRTSPPVGDYYVRSGSPVISPLKPTQITNPQETEKNYALRKQLNKMGQQVFHSAGHGIVDIEFMMGVRQDGHPASLTGDGDLGHYCMPGVPDYAMDVMLDQVVCPT